MITAGHLLDVVGRGAVTIMDGLDVVSNAYQATRTRPLMVSGARLHVLPEGARFDLVTRTLVQASPPMRRDEAEEIKIAEEDLRRLASEIAAEGVSPTYLRRRRARSRPHASEHPAGDPPHDEDGAR